MFSFSFCLEVVRTTNQSGWIYSRAQQSSDRKISRGEEKLGKDHTKVSTKPSKDNDVWLQRKDPAKGSTTKSLTQSVMWSQPRKRERGPKRKPVQANSLQMQRVDIDLTEQTVNDLK